MMLDLDPRCRQHQFPSLLSVVAPPVNEFPRHKGGLRPSIYQITSATFQRVCTFDGWNLLEHPVPDFKFWDDSLSMQYVKAKGLLHGCAGGHKGDHRQVGDLVLE